MNNNYRIIWNTALRLWQVVAETARGRGKSRSQSSLRTGAALALLAAGFAQAGQLPTDGRVVAGNASIAQAGNTLTVKQGSDKLAIDWNSFSIGAGNKVDFVQPNAASVALNRVLGSDVSVIQGALKANGQVFLINPNGVMFSPTAQVNVGGLVASTLNLKTADFLAGNYQFAGASSNAIVNQGSVVASGVIALIAAKVINRPGGSLNAPQVLLGAGSKVALDLGGPVKIEVQQGALDALIEQGGAIRANGGLVYLTAKSVGELTRTVINHYGTTEAQTLASGATGQIYLMGGMEKDRIVVGGKLDASAPKGGSGGFIETSAADVRIADSLRVTTKAAQGKTGNWLIDPNDYTIAASGGNISGAQLSSQLANTNVVIETATQGTAGGNGDIFVNDHVSWGSNNTLTLKAERDIHFGSGKITHASGSGDLILRSDSDANGIGAVKFANANARYIDFSGSHGNIKLYYNPSGSGFWKYRSPTSFDKNIQMGGGALAPYMLVNSGQDLVDFISSTFGSASFSFAALGKDIDPGAGNTLAELSGGSFRGVFDGDGHTIFNMKIGGSGMFSDTYGAILKNLTLDASNTIKVLRGGAFVGTASNSIFENLLNKADVHFVDYPYNDGGGIVKRFDGGVMINVENRGNVYAGSNSQGVGGIAGSLSNASLYRVRNYGGIFASGTPLVADSFGHGAGGIAASSYRSKFVDVQNHGAIEGHFASNTPDTQQITVGGVVGYSFEDSMAYAENHGDITVSATGRSYVGGIAGRVGGNGIPFVAHDLYSQGAFNVTAMKASTGNSNLFVGGLFGALDARATVGNKNSIANAITQFTFTLDPASNIDDNRLFTSGLIGAVSQPTEIRDSYWNASGTALKYANSPYIGSLGPGFVMSNSAAKTQAELMDLATYNESWSNWLFDYRGMGLPLGGVPTLKPVLIAYSDPVAKYYDGQAYSAEAAAAHIKVAGGSLADVSGSATVTGSYAGATQANQWGDYESEAYTTQLSGLDAADSDTMTLVNANSLFIIKPRLITVTADDKSKVYGDADPSLSWQITSGNLVGSDSLSGSLWRNPGENAGSYSINANGLSASSNYLLSKTNGVLAISKRPITVTADNASKVYGELDPTLSYQITGGNLVGNDSLSGSLSRNPGENAGRYSINANALSASSNYELTRVNGTLNITQRPISVTVGDQQKVYGNADPSFGWQLSEGSLVGSDTLAGSVTRTAGENVGRYTLDGSALSNGNYLVTVQNGQLAINPRPISVTVGDQQKVYGSADPSFGWQLSEGSLVGSDTLAGSVTRTAGENVGRYTLDGSALSNGNYLVTVQNGQFSITPRPISILADSLRKEYGSADPALTWQITSGNLIGNDTLSGSLTRASGEQAGDYGIDASQLANGNYLVTAKNGVLTILASAQPAIDPQQEVARQTAHAQSAAGPKADSAPNMQIANATPQASGADAGRSLGASGGLVFVNASSAAGDGGASAAAGDSGSASPGVLAVADSARDPSGFMKVFVVAGGIRLPQQGLGNNE